MKMTIEEAIKIVDDSISSFAPEHGAAWEALLLLQGKAGPTGFFVKEAEKRGHKLEPFKS